jgi:hypothetical protein
MGSKRDEVSLHPDESEDSFYGSSDEETFNEKLNAKEKATPKEKAQISSKDKSNSKDKTSKSNVSKVTKKKQSGSDKNNNELSVSQVGCNKQTPALDLSKLSENDIKSLRELLGIPSTEPQYADDDDITSLFGTSLENLPRMTIEVDADQISDTDDVIKQRKRTNIDMSSALFDDDEAECDTWELPRLKAPDKGKPISPSLAKVINVACTTQCETDSLISKYSVPENCEMACPPLVNNEIWKILNKRTQTQDRSIVQTQNLVASGMTPIIRLAEVLKPQIMANQEAKTLLCDALTLMGQVQFNLSIRRRYMIRPALKRKYYPLCNISQQITNKLFGDEVSKEIKACDSVSYIGRNDNFVRGRGPGRYPRRGGFRGSYVQGGYEDPYPNRYQPYPYRGQYRSGSRPYGRGFKRSANAVATPPNPHPNE